MLGVSEGKPRPVVMSYKVFQSIVERALALVAGPRGEEDIQLLLETLWDPCMKTSDGTPSYLLSEAVLRRAEQDRLAWIRRGSRSPLVPSVDGDAGSGVRFRSTLRPTSGPWSEA